MVSSCVQRVQELSHILSLECCVERTTSLDSVLLLESSQRQDPRAHGDRLETQGYRPCGKPVYKAGTKEELPQ